MNHMDFDGDKAGQYYPGRYREQKSLLERDHIEQIFKDWTAKRVSTPSAPTGFPVVCFSRMIGVGALETADLLSRDIGLPVIDRQILEYLANENGLDKRLAFFMEERCRSEIEDIIAAVFGNKTRVKSDYSHLLFKSILSLADLGPGIFVGRGAHLILPRERVLAVRLICSETFRIRRVAGIMEISELEAAYHLEKLDREQANFFSRVFDKKSAPAKEFDMVINCDYIASPRHAADVVATAFYRKFNIKESGTTGSMKEISEAN